MAAAEHRSRAGFEIAPLPAARRCSTWGAAEGSFLLFCNTWDTRLWAWISTNFLSSRELLDLFQVERRVWTIRPYEPLPDLGRKFDWITAFSIDFNRESKRDWWWGPPEWAFFLEDLKRHLNPGGRIFLGLNPKNDGEYYTPELRDFFLDRGASVERERVTFPPK